MANRIIRTMPVWGLSALAAGSISASMSDSGQAEVSSQTAPALANDPLWQDSSKRSFLTPSVQPKIVRKSRRSAAKAADSHGMNIEFVHKGRLAELAGRGSTLAYAVIGKPAVTASVPVAAVKTAIDVPASAAVADRGAIGIVDVLQVTPTNAATNMMAAASVALPKISSDAPAPGLNQTHNRAIYGTSANNAYKVYFPQVEQAAPARGKDLYEASLTSAEQDTRVLKMQGNYLFYEDQPEQPGTRRINEVLKANGASADKTVVDAIAKIGKNPEPRELTAPLLQKQPLNFGDRFLEGSPPKSNAAPTVPNGDTNAG